MKAEQLYAQLEKDFITSEMSDEWAVYMGAVADFLTDNFKQRSMGLVCDFSEEINRVYAAVFPSQKVMQEILDQKITDALLFVHHPSIWDIRKAPEVFGLMDRKQLEQFKESRIAIYTLHVPLDNFGEYSTNVTLTKALDIVPAEAFLPYCGAMAGVFGTTKLATIEDLKQKFEEAVGHKVSLYSYGDNTIRNGKVAIVAGGGLGESIEEIAQNGINVLVTGITVKNAHSEKAHEFAQKHGINLLGGTHYSTEKFACQAMVEYFKNSELPCSFIKDEPVLEDM